MASAESQSHGANKGRSGKTEQVKRAGSPKTIALVAFGALTLIALFYLSQWDYLLFHSSVEVFTIIIAFTTFAIAWNSRRLMDNNYLLFIGIAFLFVGGLDLLHTFAYKNMEVFPWIGANANVATQLWIAMRYLLAFSLLAPLLFTRRKIHSSLVFAGYSVAAVLFVTSIFYWQNFPVAYVTGVGLTPFKVGSEYVISFIFLAAMGLLYLKRQEFNGNVFKMLMAAMAFAVASELSFTLYTDVYGIANMVGHLLNVVSFYFIYRALVETGLTKPYELLFRNLKQSEANLEIRAGELTQVNDRLEAEIAEREVMSEALRETGEQLQMKLDSVLSPDVEIGEQELANIIDVIALQSIMDNLHSVTNMGFALIDLKGKVLVGTGWQDICTKFHRANPETCKNCVESDLELSSGVKQGEIRLYKCKNNLWDVVTPLVIGGKHVANVFFGQFFFKDEKVDRNLFKAQAEKYEFVQEDYLAAFDRVPKFSREKIENLMTFYSKWSDLISKLSYSNLKLAKSLANQTELQVKLEDKAAEVEEYACSMEALAEERAKKLKDVERLATIGQTAGMVGHDIRNPLQAITSELFLAKSDISVLPNGEQKSNLNESIDSIEKNVFYINKIVADLQDFARPLIPKRETVNVGGSIKESLAMVAIPENIQIKLSNVESLPPLTADSTMLKRILTNLIQNAVQAMPNGGKVTVGAIRENRIVKIIVEDTGEGIPEEAKAKLFTPLFTTKSKGQGFGLAVVKRLVEAQDGEIFFESEQGRGTKFIVQFPFN